MCGRYDLSADPEDLTASFGIRWGELSYQRRFNIAPTDQVLVTGLGGEIGDPEYMRWGLIPFWKKPDQKTPLNINARAESVATNGAFKWSFQYRRCLIPASGFFEWESRDKPVRIGMNDWTPLAFAGIWDRWNGPDGEIKSCAIITTSANELVAPIHDRMPVILPQDSWEDWLGSATDQHRLSLLKPFPSDLMGLYQVSTLVNKVQNDTAEVLRGI